MADKYTTTIEVKADTADAKTAIRELERDLDRLQAKANSINLSISGGGGGSGGGNEGGGGGGGTAGGGTAGGGGGGGGVDVEGRTRGIRTAAAAVPVFGAIAAGFALRVQEMYQRGAIDNQAARARAAAGGTSGTTGMGFVKQAGGFGFSHEEAMSGFTGFHQAAGVGGALKQVGSDNLLRLMTQGVGAQTLGGFVGLSAAGAGGVSGDRTQGTLGRGEMMPIQAARMAQSMGLGGKQIEKFLGIISSATSSMASQGLNLNNDAVNQLTAIIASGTKLNQGFRNVQAATGLGNLVGEVRGGFVAPFREAAKGAILARAAQGAKSPVDIVRNLEAFTEREGGLQEVLKQLQALGGEEGAGAMAMLGMPGVNVDVATSAMRPAGQDRIDKAAKLLSKKGVPALRGEGGAILTLAYQKENLRLSTIQAKSAKAIVTTQNELKTILSKAGQSVADLVTVIRSFVGAED